MRRPRNPYFYATCLVSILSLSPISARAWVQECTDLLIRSHLVSKDVAIKNISFYWSLTERGLDILKNPTHSVAARKRLWKTYIIEIRERIQRQSNLSPLIQRIVSDTFFSTESFSNLSNLSSENRIRNLNLLYRLKTELELTQRNLEFQAAKSAGRP